MSTIDIDSFKYTGKNYFVNKDYQMFFEPAYREIGKIRTGASTYSNWTSYKRYCDNCNKETSCYCISILFGKYSRVVIPNIYLDYCNNCSSLLLLEEKPDKVIKKAGGILIFELQHLKIKLEKIDFDELQKMDDIRKDHSVKYSEYNKTKFEIIMRHFMHKGSLKDAISNKSLAEAIANQQGGQ